MKEYIKNLIKKQLAIISPKTLTKLQFLYSFKKKLNLKNPIDINEKILWLKLNTYNNNELITNCIDKYKIREYLEEKKLTKLLPKLYGVYNMVEQIEWDKLPSSYVVKCNHGCGYNILVPDSSKLNIEDAKAKLNKWLKEDYWRKGGEIQYKYIKKKIIIEEYLKDVKNCKFYCFNGIPKTMYVEIFDKQQDGSYIEYIDYYDMDFKHLNCKLGEHSNYYGKIERPESFEKMKEIAKKLSEDFPFVRVDLYDVHGKIYISELTFIPTGGFMHFTPQSVSDEWGSWLNIEKQMKG